MSDQSPPPSPGSAGLQRRRSSFAEFFASRSSTNPPPASTVPTTVPSNVPPAQPKKAVSISTAGFGGGSPTQSNPFTAFAKQRRASASTSSSSGSPEFRSSFNDEPAVLEEDDSTAVPANTPASPFARRLSFGAQALKDVKQGTGAGGIGVGGRRPSSSLFTLSENSDLNASPTSPRGQPKATAAAGEGRGERFNWSEALRDKTKRAPSFSAASNPFTSAAGRNRSTSVNIPEPPKEMPKPVVPASAKMKKPDHLGERMLRGEFMMD